MDATDIVLRDLADEHLAVAALIAELSEPQWRTKTPADGWDIADSVSHLSFFDIRSALAMANAAGFAADTQEMMKSFTSGGDPSIAFGRSVSGAELASEWHKHSAALVAAGRGADRTQRVPWYGPSMSVASFLTARLMETWAHSVDISDALEIAPSMSLRLKHIAHIGVLARANSYRANQRVVPEANIFVSLQAPDGSMWEWGDVDASESVRGSALDFALLVTQRRHMQDTQLVAQGTLATEWLGIAQAFAGPAGAGRQPLS